MGSEMCIRDRDLTARRMQQLLESPIMESQDFGIAGIVRIADSSLWNRWTLESPNLWDLLQDKNSEERHKQKKHTQCLVKLPKTHKGIERYRKVSKGIERYRKVSKVSKVSKGIERYRKVSTQCFSIPFDTFRYLSIPSIPFDTFRYL